MPYLTEVIAFVYNVYEDAEEAGGIYAAIAQIAITVAVSVAVSKIAQVLAGKPSPAGDPPQRLQTQRGTTAYRQLIYGQIKTGGYLAYMGTSGAAGKCLVAYLESE